MISASFKHLSKNGKSLLFRPATKHFSTEASSSNDNTSEEASVPSYDNILVDRPENGLALVTLNRPKALNALCYALFKDLNEALTELDRDPEVKAILLTGSEKAFAAGADIKEMETNVWPDTFTNDMLTWWD